MSEKPKDLTNGLGVEILLGDPSNFLKIKETLTRIGIASKRDHTLYQTCHILHKQGRYWIMMFKELFALDGKTTDFTDEDRGRRNTIVNLLEEWKLLTVVDPTQIVEPVANISNIKIIAFKDKANWVLEPKYSIGMTRKRIT